MQRLRSIAFETYLYLSGAVLGVIAAPAMLFGEAAARKVTKLWARMALAVLRILTGVTHRVESPENIPTGGAVIVSNHQSMWETMALITLLPRPVVIYKNELSWLPVYGWWAKATGNIAIDRKGGAKALRAAQRTAAERIAGGCQIVMFPEGTRVLPGETKPYQSGVAGIYRVANAPCIPVAHNSGRFWRHPGVLKTPGEITIAFLPAIAPGLERRTFLHEVQARIDAARPDLAPEASPEMAPKMAPSAKAGSDGAQQTHPPRRWLYIPFAIAAIIVAGYYVLWRTGAHEMKKAVVVWTDEQRNRGIIVDHGAIKSSGFPFFLRVYIDRPEIEALGEWRWRSDGLYLDALPYDLNRLIFSPEGEQIVSIRDFGEWRGRAGDLRASIANDKTRGWVFSMTLADAAGRRTSDSATYNISSLIFDLAPAPGDLTTLTLNLAAKNLHVAAKGKFYEVTEMKTALSLSGTQALAGPNPADQWRAAGGVLTIAGFEAVIDEAGISAAGALRLDLNNHLAGAIKTEITKPAGFAELLGKTGALTLEDAETAAAGLTLMAITGGGKIAAPVEFENGVAKIGGVKVADLPKLE